MSPAQGLDVEKGKHLIILEYFERRDVTCRLAVSQPVSESIIDLPMSEASLSSSSAQ
jgi:hypothetical protein